jgi:hypothetical protein
MAKERVDEELEAAAVATADLVQRSGGTAFRYGYLRDGVPVEQAGWWARAHWGGTVVQVENQPSPLRAFTALAERVLTGAQCQRCGGLVALSDDGARAFPGAQRPDGTTWSREEIEAAGLCRWRVVGKRWEYGCVRPPEGDDKMHTTERLARALEALDDPRVKELVWQARRGHFDDFLSPHAFPASVLVGKLRALKLESMARRVVDGEFDATQAESRAWGNSEEGQQTFAALVGGQAAGTGRPSGAAFWQSQRKP